MRNPTTSTSAPRRHRARGDDPLTEISLRLHETVAVAISAVVAAGDAPSADAFVEDAVVAYLRERRRQRVYAAYVEAAVDPAFMFDMEDTMRAFEPDELE